MGAWDKFWGGQPNSWSNEQYDKFKKAYSQIVDGKFGFLDYVPPLNIPGAGGKIAMLSVKGMVSLGEKGVYAGKVEQLHQDLASWSLNEVKSAWTEPGGKAERGFNDLDAFRVFIRLCILHKVVYGRLK